MLLAAAVVMVPEMFSGPPHPPAQLAGDTAASSGQIKTYHVELQSGDSAGVAPQSSIEPPASQPVDEVPTPPVDSAATESATAPEMTEVMSSSSASSSVPSREVAPVVAAKPVAPPKAPDVATTPQGAGGWAVQIGSFGTQDKASQIVSKLQRQGYPAYLGTVTVSGKTLYRVRVGSMPARVAAEATLQKIKADYPGASVIPLNR